MNIMSELSDIRPIKTINIKHERIISRFMAARNVEPNLVDSELCSKYCVKVSGRCRHCQNRRTDNEQSRAFSHALFSTCFNK